MKRSILFLAVALFSLECLEAQTLPSQKDIFVFGHEGRTKVVMVPSEKAGEAFSIHEGTVSGKSAVSQAEPAVHRYAAQIVVGGDYRTHVLLGNPTSDSKTVTVDLSESTRGAMLVSMVMEGIPGFPPLPATSFMTTLKAGAAVALTLLPLNSPEVVQAGWADVSMTQTCPSDCSDDITVQVVYDIMDGPEVMGLVGVPATETGTEFWVNAQQTPKIGTGIAIVNPGSSDTTVTLEALGLISIPVNGIPFARVTLTLKANSQMSRFVNEYMSADPNWATFLNLLSGDMSMLGIRVTSPTPVAVTALRTVSGKTFVIGGIPVHKRK
ncbi:MAG: hypothetical protein LAO31_12225 [Acidobacteriia bacterium]|nr:hypothetical protein [Terriglobia bacterium]